ncbi:MAG: AI-2E family transporter, partial [Planctomycetota bacterium]|nr:AI-2E family transporter [Planctomycetota bacterium]
YLFRREYGDRDDERYQEAFQKFVKGKPRRVVAYEEFKTLIDDVEGGLEEREKGEIQPEVDRRFAENGAFGAWFLSEQAPLLYAAKRDEYIRKFESKLKTVLQEDYEKYRDKFILSEILDEVNSDVAQRRASQELFRQGIVESLLAKRRESPGYEPQRRAGLEKQYELMKKGNSVRYSYSFEQYLQLREAHERSEAAFAEALAEVADLDDQDPEEQFHEAFVYGEQRVKWQTWWDTFSESEEFRETVKNYREEAMGAIGTWVQGALGFIFKLTVQLPLSFLLAFIITFSFPKLRQGVKKLEKSRISGFYAEVAPGLTSFGHLIGRAFQAQGVIAVFNTLLTFLAVRLLGIENEVFLCVIVFFCSFIPVVGVVLSSVPIAAMAIVQPGGSVIVALEITAAILLIHFIETTVLNPKILGDMLHLHPVMVLAVLAIAGHYFGAWGLLLGVPVAVYIIRFVILDEGIPGLIEPTPGRAAVAAAGHPGPGDARALAVEREDPGSTKEAPQVDKESDERMSPAAHHGEEASASAGPKSARTVRAKD